MSCDNFRVDASNKVTISSGDKMLLDSSGENDNIVVSSKVK